MGTYGICGEQGGQNMYIIHQSVLTSDHICGEQGGQNMYIIYQSVLTSDHICGDKIRTGAQW